MVSPRAGRQGAWVLLLLLLLLLRVSTPFLSCPELVLANLLLLVLLASCLPLLLLLVLQLLLLCIELCACLHCTPTSLSFGSFSSGHSNCTHASFHTCQAWGKLKRFPVTRL